MTTYILGIDPGLEKTGWSVVKTYGNEMQFVAGGVIRTSPKSTIAERLRIIYEDLTHIMQEYKPEYAAVEEVFVNTNAKTSLKLGQARGICLLVPRLYGATVVEYTPLQVKKAVVGYGHAEKEQVAQMVRLLLPTARFSTSDTSDACAIAICHAHTSGSLSRYGLKRWA